MLDTACQAHLRQGHTPGSHDLQLVLKNKTDMKEFETHNAITKFHGMVSRGSRSGRPIVRNAILALSDKWLSLDTRPMDEQIIIAQMSFINLGQVHI